MARTREFNEDQALHQAMLLFWKKGYEGNKHTGLAAGYGH